VARRAMPIWNHLSGVKGSIVRNRSMNDLTSDMEAGVQV